MNFKEYKSIYDSAAKKAEKAREEYVNHFMQIKKLFESFWKQQTGIRVKGKVVWGDSRFVGTEGVFVIAEEPLTCSAIAPRGSFGYPNIQDYYSLIPSSFLVHPYKKNGEVSKVVWEIEPTEIYWNDSK